MSVLQVSPTFPANISEKDVMLSYLPLAHIFDRYLASMLCKSLRLRQVCLTLSCMHHCLQFTSLTSRAPRDVCTQRILYLLLCAALKS